MTVDPPIVIARPSDASAIAVMSRDLMEYLDDEAYLVLFAVAKPSQRQGVGSALLRWLEAAARAAGSQRIRVDTRRESIGARCFYNEHGYHERVLRPRMYGKRVDGIR